MRFPTMFAALLLAATSLVLSSCEDTQQAAAPAPPEVTVANPVVRPVIDWDGYVGQFEAVERVELRPRVTGYLVEVLFEEGEMVEEGDVMFRIDPRPFQAALDAARSREAAAEARLNNAATELERATGLRDIQAVSSEEFEELQAVQRSAAAELEAARAERRAAELDVEFTRIKAPISGRASYRRLDVGNAVRADETLLTTIVSVDPIHFSFQGSEALYLKYRRQQEGGLGETPVRIRLQDEAQPRWTGYLDFMDNALNPNAGTIMGRAVVDNPDGFLTPGMFGHMLLQASDEYMGVLLPDTAIGTRGAQRIVYVVDEEGVVSTKAVELGQMDGDLRVIRSGLEAEDVVVINGLQRAFPGRVVQPVRGQIETPAAPGQSDQADFSNLPQSANAVVDRR